jgi:hypothetical protein
MIYILVCIGNSDNKLTQQEWAKFVQVTGEMLQSYESARHFFGGSETYAPWQNVCWLCMINDAQLPEIKRNIRSLCDLYRQESAYILTGMGEFV